MVDFKRLSDRAKDLVEKRGGSDSLKRDADELKNIATGPGSLKDKAKAAAEAIREPGARDEAVAEQVQSAAPAPAEETAERGRGAARRGGGAGPRGGGGGRRGGREGEGRGRRREPGA